MGALSRRRARRYGRRCAVPVACLALLLAACGGTSKEQPTTEDADLVAAAVADIVFQCGSFTEGLVAEPDAQALERDVAALLEAYERLEPDTAIEIGAEAGIPRTTTLREELRFSARILDDGCFPEQAQPLEKAASD